MNFKQILCDQKNSKTNRRFSQKRTGGREPKLNDEKSGFLRLFFDFSCPGISFSFFIFTTFFFKKIYIGKNFEKKKSLLTFSQNQGTKTDILPHLLPHSQTMFRYIRFLMYHCLDNLLKMWRPWHIRFLMYHCLDNLLKMWSFLLYFSTFFHFLLNCVKFVFFILL